MKPILLIEDDFAINALVECIKEEVPNLNIVIVTTKKDAIAVLEARNDFEIAFVDWHLEDGDSKGIIPLIKQTQINMKMIYATSSCDDSRKKQVCIEGAHRELIKMDIPFKLEEK